MAKYQGKLKIPVDREIGPISNYLAHIGCEDVEIKEVDMYEFELTLKSPLHDKIIAWFYTLSYAKSLERME